jgi:glutathione S-transferase
MPIVQATNSDVLSLEGLHLYHASTSNCSARVRLLLEEKGLTWENHHIDLKKKENISEAYFGINSKGLVPSLVHDGVVITESNDILRYLETTFIENNFSPESTEDHKLMEELLVLSAEIHMPGIKTFQYIKVNTKSLKKTEEEVARYHELQKHEEMLTFHNKHDLPGSKFSDEDFSSAVEMLSDAFSRINTLLDGGKWILGNDYTLADISWSTTITTLLRGDFDFSKFPNVVDWYSRMQARPTFKKAVTDWLPKPA